MPAHHILAYARDLSGGGIERALLALAREWTMERRVTLVLGSTAGPLAAELSASIDLVELDTPSMARLALRLPGIVRERRPDILFCPGNHYTSIAAWTRFRLGRATPPIVAKQSNAARRGDHGELADFGHRAWLAQHRRFLDHLVALTPALAAQVERATGMAGQVGVIPNPPPSPRPGPVPPLPTRFILGVGRLARQKRWDRLIGALPALPGIGLVIAGEGSERPFLLHQATELGVADRLRLLGHVADPLPIMARAAVLTLTSDYEGAPGVLAEALTVGTPVVATDASPAVGEIVVSAALGTIVPRDDPAALVAALRHWLDSDAVRPPPQPQPGADSAARYLDLFDRLVDAR